MSQSQKKPDKKKKKGTESETSFAVNTRSGSVKQKVDLRAKTVPTTSGAGASATGLASPGGEEHDSSWDWKTLEDAEPGKKERKGLFGRFKQVTGIGRSSKKPLPGQVSYDEEPQPYTPHTSITSSEVQASIGSPEGASHEPSSIWVNPSSNLHEEQYTVGTGGPDTSATQFMNSPPPQLKPGDDHERSIQEPTPRVKPENEHSREPTPKDPIRHPEPDFSRQQANIQGLQSKLEEVEKQRDREVHLHEEAKRELERAKKEHQAQIEQKERQHRAFLLKQGRDKNSQIQEQGAKLQAQQKQLQVDKQKLEDLIATTAKAQEEKETQMQQLQKQRKEMEEQLQQMKKEQQKLQITKGADKDELLKLQQQLKDKGKEVETERDHQHKYFQGLLENKGKQLKEAGAQQEKAQKRVIELDEQKRQLEVKIQETEQQCELAVNQKEKLDVAFQQSQGSKASLEEALKISQVQLQESGEKLHIAKQEYEQLEKREKMYEEQLQEKQRESQEATSKLEREKQQLEQELQTTMRKVEELQSKAPDSVGTQLEQQHKYFQQLLDRQEEQTKKAQVQLEESKKDKAELTEQVQQLNVKIEEMTRQHEMPQNQKSAPDVALEEMKQGQGETQALLDEAQKKHEQQLQDKEKEYHSKVDEIESEKQHLLEQQMKDKEGEYQAAIQKTEQQNKEALAQKQELEVALEEIKQGQVDMQAQHEQQLQDKEKEYQAKVDEIESEKEQLKQLLEQQRKADDLEAVSKTEQETQQLRMEAALGEKERELADAATRIKELEKKYQESVEKDVRITELEEDLSRIHSTHFPQDAVSPQLPPSRQMEATLSEKERELADAATRIKQLEKKYQESVEKDVRITELEEDLSRIQSTHLPQDAVSPQLPPSRQMEATLSEKERELADAATRIKQLEKKYQESVEKDVRITELEEDLSRIQSTHLPQDAVSPQLPPSGQVEVTQSEKERELADAAIRIKELERKYQESVEKDVRIAELEEDLSRIQSTHVPQDASPQQLPPSVRSMAEEVSKYVAPEHVLPSVKYAQPLSPEDVQQMIQIVNPQLLQSDKPQSFVFAVLPAHNQMHSHLFDYTGHFHPGRGLGMEAEQLPSLCALPKPPAEERVEDEDEEFGTPPNTPDEPRQFPPNATDEEIAASMTDSDKIKRLQTTVDQFHKKYEDTRRQLEEEKQAFSARVAQLQQELEAKEHEMKELEVLGDEKEKIQELTEKVKETQQEKAMMQTKAEMKEREIERLRKALMRATEGLDVDPKEADAYLEQLVELTMKVTEHEVTEREQKKKIEDLQKVVDRAHLLEEHLTQAATELSAKEEESKQLHKVLKGQGMEDELDRLRPFEQQVKELQSQLEEAKQKVKANDDKIRALEEQLEAKKEELQLAKPAVFPHNQPTELPAPDIDHNTEVARLRQELGQKDQDLHNLKIQLKPYTEVLLQRDQFQRHAKRQSEQVLKLKDGMEAVRKEKLTVEQKAFATQRKVEKLEDDLSTARKENEKELERQLKEQTAALQHALTTEQEERARLHAEVKHWEANVRDLESKLQMEQISVQVADMQSTDHEQVVASFQHALSEANADRNILREKLERITNQRDQINQRYLETRAAKENLEAQVSHLDDLQSWVTQMKANAERWKETIANQKEELRILRESLAIMSQENQELKGENQELKGDVEAQKAQAEIWKADFEQERHDRAKAAGKQDNERAKKSVETQILQGDLVKLRHESAFYQKELQIRSQEVQQYKSELERKRSLEEKYETCQGELQQCKLELDKHQEQLENMETLFQAQKTSHLETQNDLKAQQISHSETQKELKEARQTLEGALKGSSDLHDEVLAKTQQVKQYKKQADQYKTQLEELKVKLTAIEQHYQQEAQRLTAQSQSQQAVGQREVEGLLQERDTLYAQIHDLTTRMGGGGQVPDVQSAQYEALRRKYDQIMDKYDRLFQKNEHLQNLLKQHNIPYLPPPKQGSSVGATGDVLRAKIEQPQLVARSPEDPQQRQLGGGPTYPVRGPQQMGIPHSPRAPQQPYQLTPQYQQPVTPQYPHHPSPIYKDGSQSAFQQRMQGDMSQTPQLFPSQHQQQEEAYWRQQQQQPFRMKAHSVDDPRYLQHLGTNAAGGHYHLGQAQTQAPMHPPNVPEVPGNYGYPQGYEDPGRPAFHPSHRQTAPQIVDEYQRDHGALQPSQQGTAAAIREGRPQSSMIQHAQWESTAATTAGPLSRQPGQQPPLQQYQEFQRPQVGHMQGPPASSKAFQMPQAPIAPVGQPSPMQAHMQGPPPVPIPTQAPDQYIVSPQQETSQHPPRAPQQQMVTRQPQGPGMPPDDSLETGLMKNLGGEIHQAAADVEANVEEASYPPVTQEHIPFDPNLVCPYCSKQFRIGQIQKFKRHVNACQGT